MHIKKFEGRDLKEALTRIRAELGPEAVILESSQGTRGVTVLAASPRTAPRFASAAVPRPAPVAAMTAAVRQPAPGAAMAAALLKQARPAAKVALVPRPAPVAKPAPAAAQTAAVPKPAPRVALVAPAPIPGALIEELQERVQHLNRLVRSDHFSTIPLPLRQLYFDLTDAEVDADLVFQILQRMGRAPMPGQFTPAPSESLLPSLQELIRVGGVVEPGQGRRVLALVGPTGVGKTTTVAKIAGHAAFRLGLQTALLSTDSYRVFGAQHLSSYAALMGLPFEVVGTASELRWLLRERLAKADLVLIDTSGRSPRDPRGIQEIHQLLAGYPDLDVHLVLAANTRARDLALALDSFCRLPVRHLLFTKLDEATSHGALFTTALKARRPVSYLGTGQEVPDDLTPATPELLTRGILGASARGGADA
jgi:flagellar biosynthesis protein FlhF